MSWQRALRTGSSVMTTIILITTLGLVMFSAARQLSQKGRPKQVAYRVMVVLSGSMSPVFNTGDGIILASNREKPAYRIGEIITFKDPENIQRLITHRVIGVVKAGNHVSYRTKGDANNYPDLRPIPAENVIGQEIWRLPYFGKVIEFVQTSVGAALLIIVSGLSVIAGEFGSSLRSCNTE